MKAVTMFQTYDGQRHSTEKLAVHHLDKLYADKLGKLTRDLVNLNIPKSNHLGVSEYIDEHLSEFNDLAVLVRDRVLEGNDADNDS